jgi:hypothetical protein
MGGNTSLGSGGSFGGGGTPGFFSPFDVGVTNAAAANSQTAMANRYNQLGMPGSTPEAMDLGSAPSLTGGLPGQFQALQGEIQSQDLGLTSGSATAALQSKGNQIGLLGQGAGLLGGLF